MSKKKKFKFRVGPRLLSAFVWKKRIPIEEWAEQDYVLEEGSAVGGGRFSLRHTPHLRKPLNTLNQHHTLEHSLWFGSQLGKTTVGMILLNYFADRIGGIVMFFLPNDTLVPFTATDRILPAIKRTVNRFSLIAAREQGKLRENTKNIRLIGTLIRILGANTASNRKSTPGKLIIMDEIAEFAHTHVEEIEERGKALCLKTPLPTPDGWTTMGEVKVGDILFDENGHHTKVTFVTGVQLNRGCYEVTFSTGETIIADADHRWLVEYISANKKRKAIKTTSEMALNVKGYYIISTPYNLKTVDVLSIKPVETVPVKCLTVDSPSHLFLAGKSMIPTHNTYELYGGIILKTSTSLYPNDPIVQAHKFAECQMEYYLRCQKCGKYHIDDFFENVIYPKRADVDIPEDMNDEDSDVFYRLAASRGAFYRCPHCGDLWDNDGLNAAIDEGDWKPDRGDPKTCGSIVWRASSMISKFVTIGRMVDKWLKAEGDEGKEDKFYNGWLSRVYTPEVKGTPAEEVLKLIGETPRYKVPENVIGLFMAIDVQKDHYYFVTRAVTSDMAIHDIDYGRIETEVDFENLMFRTYDDHFVEVIGVDSGYDSQRIYDLCYRLNHLHEENDPHIEEMFAKRAGVALNLVPLKGNTHRMTTISQISVIEKDMDGNAYADSQKLHVINKMMFEDVHFNYLRRSLDEEYDGHRKLHLHAESEGSIAESYVSEYKKEVEDNKGRITYEYVPIKSHPFNHYLDCSVYLQYLIEKYDVKFRTTVNHAVPTTVKVPDAEPAPERERGYSDEHRPDWLDEF